MTNLYLKIQLVHWRIDQLNHSVHGAGICPLCPGQNTRTTSVSYAQLSQCWLSFPFLSFSPFPPSKLWLVLSGSQRALTWLVFFYTVLFSEEWILPQDRASTASFLPNPLAFFISCCSMNRLVYSGTKPCFGEGKMFVLSFYLWQHQTEPCSH